MAKGKKFKGKSSGAPKGVYTGLLWLQVVGIGVAVVAAVIGVYVSLATKSDDTAATGTDPDGDSWIPPDHFFDTIHWNRSTDGSRYPARSTLVSPTIARHRYKTLPRSAPALPPHPLPQKVVIVGIIRDKADQVPQLIRNVEGLGSLFTDYRVVLVENDSVDDTVPLLRRWERSNSRVKVIQRESDPGNFARKPRHERYIVYRNDYLEEVRRLRATATFAADIMIGMDTDFLYDFELGGVIDAMRSNPIDGGGKQGQSPPWDVMCAHATHRNGDAAGNPADSLASAVTAESIYDVVAYRDKMVTDNAFENGGKMFLFKRFAAKAVHRQLLYGGKRSYWPMVPVTSCFSGLAFYRVDALIDAQHELRCKYSCLEIPGNDAGNTVCDCEHVALHECMAQKRDHAGSERRMFVNPLLHVHAPKITVKENEQGAQKYDEELPGSAVSSGSKFLPSELLAHGAARSAFNVFHFFGSVLAGGRGFTFWESLEFAINAIRALPTEPRGYQLAARVLRQHGHNCDAEQLELWARGFRGTAIRAASSLCDTLVSFSPEAVRQAVDELTPLPPWHDGLQFAQAKSVVAEVYSEAMYVE